MKALHLLKSRLSSLLLKYPQGKYAIILLIFILIFFAYKIYAWVNTESTDNAYLEADISLVSSEVSGVMTELLVEENSFVTAGQVIARIDSRDYLANLKKAEAAVEGAQKEIAIIEQNISITEIEQEKAEENYDFAEASYKIAENDYARTRELNRDKFTSKKNLDTTEIAFAKAKNDFIQSELNTSLQAEELSLLNLQKLAAFAKLESARQDLILATTALEHTNIKAPISGVIGNSSLKIGNYIKTGVPLFAVVPIDNLYIKANFKETQIAKFRVGMKAELRFDAFPDYKISGTVKSISPATGAKFSLIPPANATGNFTKIVQRIPVVIAFENNRLENDKFETPKFEKAKSEINSPAEPDVNTKPAVAFLMPGMSCLVKIRTDRKPEEN